MKLTVHLLRRKIPPLILLVFYFPSSILLASFDAPRLFRKQIVEVNRALKESHNKQEELELIEERLEEVEARALLSHEAVRKKFIKGENDPSFPVSFETKPARFQIEASLQKKIFTHVKKSVSLKDLTPQVLKSLDDKSFSSLARALSKRPMELKWKDKKGHCHSGKKTVGIRFSHWEKSNGAGALALALGMKKEKTLLTRLLLEAPDAVTTTLRGDAYSILTDKIVAQVLYHMIGRAPLEKSRQVASSAANLVQVYLSYWAEEKAHRLVIALTGLVLATSKLLKKGTYEYGPPKKGILLGALLSGALLRATCIKSHDEKRLWIVNSIANLAWAASTFLGVLPIAGSIAAGIAASLSMAVVAWSVVSNKIGVRDYSPKLKEIEGHIEFSALEAARHQGVLEGTVEILEMLAWMRCTIHINGLSD